MNIADTIKNIGKSSINTWVQNAKSSQNALQSAAQMAKKIMSTNPITVGSTIKSAVSNVKTDMPAYKAYVGMKIQKAVTPKIPARSYKEQMGEIEKNKKLAKTMTAIQMGQEDLKRDNWYWEPEATKSNSAEMIPYTEEYNDPKLNSLKQATLDAMNLRPAMRKYFEQLPVQEAENSSQFAGMSKRGEYVSDTYPEYVGGTWETDTYGNEKTTPGIVLTEETIKNPNFNTSALAHEYLHNAPRATGTKEQIQQLYENIKKTNPQLLAAALQYYQNGEVPPNIEELFATLGEQYREYALNIPEIRTLYENVFNKPSTQDVPFSYEDRIVPGQINVETGKKMPPRKIPIKVYKNANTYLGE